MNKELNGLPIFFFNQAGQGINFFVRFMHIQIPGNGQVAIQMYPAAIFYDPQVMQVNPVLPAVLIPASPPFF
jgi:hypothetical protein